MGSSFPKHTHMCVALITFHPSCCKSLEDFTAGDCHLHETSKFLTLFLSQPSWYFHLPRGGVFLSPGKTMPEVFFSCHGGWPWGWLWDSKGLGMGPSLTVLWSYSLWGKIWNNTESSNSNNNGPIRAVSDHWKNRGPGPKGPRQATEWWRQRLEATLQTLQGPQGSTYFFTMWFKLFQHFSNWQDPLRSL